MHRTKRKKKGKRCDALLKVYFHDSYRFADMMNGILFHGQQIITSSMLEDYDTDTSTYFESHQAKVVAVIRNRDMIKKVNIDDKVGLIAIENQSHVDRKMLYRVREYDSYTCLNQYYYQQSRPKKFLLHIMTVILYYGPKPWKGAKSFNELALQAPLSLQEFMNYPMVPIVSIIDLDYHYFHNQDNQNLIKGLQLIYRFNGNLEMLEGMIVSKIVASLLAVFSDDDELYDMIQMQKKEEVNMCESMRIFRENNIQEGIRKGRAEGRIDTLTELLQHKFGILSQDTMTKLKNSDEKKLRELSIHIFDIHHEKEIIEILMS